MCKIYSVVYLSLFVLSVIESSEMKDEAFVERPVISSKHHHKSKPPKLNGDNGVKLNIDAIKDYEADIQNEPEPNEELILNEKPSNNDNDENERVEDSKETGDHIPKTSFDSSLTRRMNIAADNDDDFDDDYKSDDHFEEDDTEIGTSDSSDDNTLTELDNGLIYTPNRKTLSQDVVLDLKARTGNLQSDKEDSAVSSDEALSSSENTSQYNFNKRSGFVGNDDYDSKPELDVNRFNHVNSAYNNDLSQFHHPKSVRPFIHNFYPNAHQRFPTFFNKFNSREQMYINDNSHDNNQHSTLPGQMNTIRASYFGYSHPKTQTYNQKIEKCFNCQDTISSGNNNLGKSAEADVQFETADGRLLDSKPSGGNSYPLVQMKGNAEERSKISDNNFIKGESRISSNEGRGLFPSKTDFNRIIKPSNYNLELDPLSNILMPYIQSPILISRRFGLGRNQRLVGY